MRRRSSPLGHMLRSGIDGVILRVLHCDLQSGWASLKSQQCMRAPFAPHPFQHWLSLVLLGLCHSDSGKRKSQNCFGLHFPNSKEKQLFFENIFNHVISSFENSLFRYQEHSFWMGGLFFWVLCVVCYPLSDRVCNDHLLFCGLFLHSMEYFCSCTETS